MKSIGNKYEKIAQEYLKKNSFIIIDKNIFIGKREIDILCIDEKNLVIVEVKYRSKKLSYNNFPILTKKQKQNLLECILLIKNIKKYEMYNFPEFCRIDLIYFYKSDFNYTKFKHYKNINIYED